MNSELYDKFLSLNLLDYHSSDKFGSDNFTDSLSNLNNNVKVLLDECIRIINNNEKSIPTNLVNIVDSNIQIINGFVATINALRDKWVSNPELERRKNVTQEVRQAINSINDYVNVVYFGRTLNGNQSNNNLLMVVSLIRTYDNKVDNIIKDYNEKNNVVDENINQLNSIIQNFNNETEAAKSITQKLRQEAAKKVVYDYSNIFQEQAYLHSHVDWKTKFYKWMGSAERWLIVGSMTTISLFVFVIFMYQWFPTVINDKLDIPNLVTKLSLLSIIIFLITFSFKQYSINKHLHTLNKHRENVLNSYQLFLSAISSEDSTTKNALMLEVAKSIYEQGKTGFINDKDGDSGSPSIIEFTKYLQKDKLS